MYATNQFKKGLKLEIDGTPYVIVDFQHVSPGKGSAFTRTKLKNLLTSNMTEKTFRSGEKVDRADVMQSEMQYLYEDSTGFHFMNTSNYEQITIVGEVLGENKDFLMENLTLSIMTYNGRPIGVELPPFVVLKVVDTEPAFRGDTVSGSGKPAKLETGASVSVPAHIKEGDTIKVDTRSRSYVEKVKV